MKKSYKIDVDCALCASKIEAAAKNVDGVKDCVVNFRMQKMIVDFSEGCDREKVMNDVRSASKKVERDAEIYI